MATPPTTTTPALAALPAAVPYPTTPGITLNQVAVRQQLDVKAIHAKALEQLARRWRVFDRGRLCECALARDRVVWVRVR